MVFEVETALPDVFGKKKVSIKKSVKMRFCVSKVPARDWPLSS